MSLFASLRSAAARTLDGPGKAVATWMIRRRLHQNGPARAVPPAEAVGDRLLVLAPHPDDEVLGCGGLLGALHTGSQSAAIIWFTSGERGVGGPPAKLGPTREVEATEAARRLGIERVCFLRAEDGAVERTAGVAERLADVIRDVRPDTILVPNPWDAHPDHRATARLLLRAASLVTDDAAQPVRILAYHVEAFLAPHWTNLIVDVSQGMERRRKAAEAHVSQTMISPSYLARFEWAARLIGEHYGVPAAECYWKTDLQGLGTECAATAGRRVEIEIGRWGRYRHLPRHLARARRFALRLGRPLGTPGATTASSASAKP